MLSDTLKTKDRRRRHAKFRKLIIAASEEQFENQTKGYDYFIDLNDKIEAYHSDCVNQMLDYCETVEKWLADNCKGEYICFPPGMGKYLCKSNGIYFKSKDDAFLFKLLF